MDKSGYVLQILDPKGAGVLRTFSNEPGQAGVSDGVSASADPFSGCDALNWNARPDLMQSEGGQVIRAWVKDSTGLLHPVFYGALTTGDAAEPSETVEPYEASARLLLLATACRGDRYKQMDTAAIAFDLVNKYRHAALKVRASDFPASGTVLDIFTAKGALADVLDELVEATENAAFGAGIDPEGFCFFRSNTSVLELDYESTDYEDMKPSGASIVTATLWTFDEEPAIKPWSGAYVPRPYTYLSVPDTAAHDLYGYERTRDIPAYAFQSVPEADYTSSGFTNPANAVAMTPTTPAVRSSTTTGVFTLTNDDPFVFGVRLLYRASEDAGAVRLRANCGVLYDVELPDTKGELQPFELKLPPHEGAFSHWQSFRLTALTGGTFELHSFYLLRINSALLDTVSPVVVPERRPGQVASAGILPNAATIRLLNAPRGTRDVPGAGLRWGWNPVAGAETVHDLEVSAYEEDAAKTQRVEGYYRRPSK